MSKVKMYDMALCIFLDPEEREKYYTEVLKYIEALKPFVRQAMAGNSKGTFKLKLCKLIKLPGLIMS